MPVTEITKAILRKSRYTHMVWREDAICLYHALTLRTIYGGQLLADLYETFKEPLCCDAAVEQLSGHESAHVWRAIQDLHEAGLLVPTTETDTQLYFKLFQRGLDQYRIQHMYFIPTIGCNLRCRYCFVDRQTGRSSRFI